MEVNLKRKDEPIVDEMIDFLKGLSEEEQREVGTIIQGVVIGIKFAKSSAGGESLKKAI